MDPDARLKIMIDRMLGLPRRQLQLYDTPSLRWISMATLDIR